MQNVLVVMRHAEAIYSWPDQTRPLTPYGQAHATQMGAWLAKHLPEVPQIWASPFTRTQQTAHLVAQHWHQPCIGDLDWLLPTEDPYVVLEQMLTLAPSPQILISHQPLVSDVISLLTQGHLHELVPMNTASAAWLHGEVRAAACMDLHALWHVQDLLAGQYATG